MNSIGFMKIGTTIIEDLVQQQKTTCGFLNFLAPVFGAIGSALGIGGTAAAAGTAATSLGGSLLTALAPVALQGFIGNKQAKSARAAALQDGATQFSRLRSSAEAGGFNPLTALMGGGLNAFSGLPSGVAPLISPTSMANFAKDVSSILTGEDQRARDRQDVADEMARIQLDQLKAGGAGPIVRATVSDPTIGAVRGANPKITNPSDASWFDSAYAPEAPAIDDPTTVMRTDGMTSANPDAPVEFEGDIWSWARDGTMLPNLAEIYMRNTMTQGQRSRARATADGIENVIDNITTLPKKGEKTGGKAFPRPDDFDFFLGATAGQPVYAPLSLN